MAFWPKGYWPIGYWSKGYWPDDHEFVVTGVGAAVMDELEGAAVGEHIPGEVVEDAGGLWWWVLPRDLLTAFGFISADPSPPKADPSPPELPAPVAAKEKRRVFARPIVRAKEIVKKVVPDLVRAAEAQVIRIKHLVVRTHPSHKGVSESSAVETSTEVQQVQAQASGSLSVLQATGKGHWRIQYQACSEEELEELAVIAIAAREEFKRQYAAIDIQIPDEVTVEEMEEFALIAIVAREAFNQARP